MIYEYPDVAALIRQGDIFVGLPRVEVSLGRIPVMEEDGSQTHRDWREIAALHEEVTAILPVRPSLRWWRHRIAMRRTPETSRYVRSARSGKSSESQPKRLPPRSGRTSSPSTHINQKWFYLPPDERIGFTDKIAVNFMVTLRVPRRAGGAA